MKPTDRELWTRISGRLDELLELEPAARHERLRAIQAEDAEQGSALQSLLAGLTAVDSGNFLQTPAPLLVGGVSGQQVGAYTLERELGHGGMSSVWLARRTDGRYEGQVAIKFLSLALIQHGGSQRFAQEGVILARLAHPNIARLIDAGVTASQQPYLVLEYVDGEPIDRYCERVKLSTSGRLRLFLDVLAAVAHAHNRLILHRDVKPANILVTAAGEVKLLDFGIAKLIDDAHRSMQASELTQVGGRPCTLAYAAPEQLHGGEVTIATDVYALGVLLYVLLSGKHPILTAPLAGPLEQLRTLLEVEPLRLSAAVRDRPALAREQRSELDSILAKALRKSSGERYANAAAFADDVQRYLSHLPLQARADTWAYRTLKFTRRHRFGLAAAAALVLTLAGGVTATLQQALEVRAQQSKAEALIDFMLGDLRDKLQAVGRLDAMDAVGERALTYYDAQPSRLLDDAALGRRSRAMQLIGEIADLRGNFDQAATYFRSSAASTEARLRSNPKHPPNIYNHAQSVYWTGYVAWKRGLLPEAKRAFDEYLALTQQLVRIDASNVDWQIEEGYAHQNLGVLLLDQAEFAAALGALERGRQRFAAHVAQRPALRGTLLSSHGWIAKAKEPLGDLAGAVEEIRTQIELQRGKPDADSNRRIQQAIAVGEADLARLELNRGDAAAARQHALRAVDLLQTLVAVDPANEFWAQQLAWSHLRRAEAEHALGEMEAAQTSLRSAQLSVDAVFAKAGGAAVRQAGLAGRVLVARAELGLQAGHPVPAAQVRDWIAARAADPLVSRMQYIAAQAHLVLGDTYSRGGDVHAARDQWQAGSVLLARQAQSDPMTLTVRAQLRARLGDSAGARELVDRVARTDFKHPAYVELQGHLAGIKVAAK